MSDTSALDQYFLKSGYSQDELNVLKAMGQAQKAAKQSALDAANANDLSLYEKKLQLENKYKVPAPPTPPKPGELTETEKAAIAAGTASSTYDPETKNFVVKPIPSTTEVSKQKSSADTLTAIDRLLNGDIGAITGFNQLYSYIPGTSGAQAKVDWENLQNLLSLAKRGELKGTGTISDFEQRMLAKAATAGLDRSLSETEFRSRLQQLRDSLTSGEDKISTKTTTKTQEKPLGEKITSGLLKQAENIGNFFLPETTKAIKSEIQKPGSLTTPSEAKLGTGAKLLDFALSVLPGGALPASLKNIPQLKDIENTPLMSAQRELASNILANQAISQVGAPVLKAASKIPGVKTVTNYVGGLKNKAINALAGLTSKEYENFALDTGMDLTKTIGKWIKGKGDLSNLVGTAENGFSKGTLHTAMNDAETVIKNRVAKEGTKVVAFPQEVTRQLENKIAAIPEGIGKEETISALQEFVTNFQKRYADGITAKELLTLKRSIDKTFGAAVQNTDKGAATAQAQKMVANSARSILRQAFPDIADALDTEQELINLIPIIRDQVSKLAVNKNIVPGAVKAFDISRPQTAVTPIIESALSKKILSGNLGAIDTALGLGKRTLPPILGSQMVKGLGSTPPQL